MLKKSCASLSVSVPLHYGFVQKPAVCTGIDLLTIIFRRIAYYIWGYLGYVLKFQTHIDMLTCLLFRKCLGGRPNLEEIFCQSQHPSDINPGLTNPLLIRMISTVISMGFQVLSAYPSPCLFHWCLENDPGSAENGSESSKFIFGSTGSRSRHPSSALARASVNQGVLVCIQCAGTSASEATIMKPMRLEYSKTFRLKMVKLW